MRQPSVTKLVIIDLGEGNFEQGFPVVNIEIGNEGERPTVRTQGELLPSPNIQKYYDKWRSAYRSLVGTYRLGGKAGQTKNVSLDEIKETANSLEEELNSWLNSESFRPIKETLLDKSNEEDEVRVIIQTENVKIRGIPWQLWDFFNRRPKAEVALAKPTYQRPEKSHSRKSVRILAILGDRTEINSTELTGINVEKDKQLLENLPHAEIAFLVESQRQELYDSLWNKQGWDIISFSGHSRTEGKTGQIDINPTDSLNIADLKHALEKAIERGLHLAIFNSCDGLGLAWQLENLHIPQIIVMREPVPDKVAQEFLKYFLQAFSNNESFYLAVHEARKRLQEELENQFPNASWLPVICQNPAEIPLSWNQLCYRDNTVKDDNKGGILEPTRYHNIPINIVNKEKFVGREEYLLELDGRLKKDDASVAVICAIEGMGGIGKTELALQYAILNLQTYQGGICCLYARNQDVGLQIVQFVENNFPKLKRKIPEERDLKGKVDFCWSNWVDGNVLVILDDVQDYSKLESYLPKQSRFKVLTTTRLKSVELSHEPLILGVLTEEASLDFLRQWVGNERISQELDKAKTLCQWLGYLPLGLQLIGRYMKQRKSEKKLSLETMLHRLEKKGLKHSSLVRNEKDHTWILTAKRGVAAAFELSWEELTNEAQQLGCLLSLFALAPIPWILVEKVASEQDAEDLENERFELENLYLIQGEQTYQFHQLIREFFQGKLEELPNKDDMKRAFAAAMVEQARQIPDTPPRKMPKSLTDSIPHIEEVTQFEIQALNDDDIYWPFIGLARFYNGQGLYAQVEQWCEKGLSVGQARFGTEVSAQAQDTIAILWLLQAKVLRIKGEYEQAIKKYQQSLNNLSENQKGQKVRAFRGLGHAYRLFGEHDKSIQNYEASLTLARTIKDEKGEARAAYGVARIYRLQGDLKTAKSRYQEASNAFKPLELPADEAWALFGLAEVQRMMGNIEPSRKSYSESFVLFKDLKHKEGEAYAAWGVGEINRLGGESEAKKGNIDIANKHFEAAKENYNRSLEICQKISDRRSEAWALLGVAEVLRMEGKYQESVSQTEAVEKYQEALTKYEQTHDLVVGKECVETAHAILGIAATKRLLKLVGVEDDSTALEIEQAYVDALKIYKDHQMNYCIVYVLIDRALYALSQSDYEQFQSDLNQAEAICVEKGYAPEKSLIEKIRKEQDSGELHTLNFP